MESIARALAVYFFLLILIRVTGKRSIAQITTFDFVLLLIVAETTQQALLGDDFSLTNCFLLLVALFGTEHLLSLLSRRFHFVRRWVDSVPLILAKEGECLEEPMRRSGVSRDDILESAREKHGIMELSKIQYAILERNGVISIIPREPR